ncbi:MAG: hypothetical protein AB7O79_05860 [Xanthobacteraceae bacterium]|jgi:hypothetical protein
MGLLVRFPLERARAVPPVASEGESAAILVLPVIRIEREKGEALKKRQPKTRTRSGSRSRRHTKRPA